MRVRIGRNIMPSQCDAPFVAGLPAMQNWATNQSLSCHRTSKAGQCADDSAARTSQAARGLGLGRGDRSRELPSLQRETRLAARPSGRRLLRLPCDLSQLAIKHIWSRLEAQGVEGLQRPGRCVLVDWPPSLRSPLPENQRGKRRHSHASLVCGRPPLSTKLSNRMPESGPGE